MTNIFLTLCLFLLPVFFLLFRRRKGKIIRGASTGEQLLREKRLELSKGAPSHQGLISCLLSIPGEGNAEVLYEEEIIRNVLLMPKGWQIFWVAAMTRMDSSISHKV
ncbi:unnamed protein product [Coffea canephora]|uniref:Uncharacterized protein n=1 Tax=Coffea canephora TaxID=49390 RepID=A0A068UBW8_COFCA|nr:unnamed protein product [Coffea canephora]